MPKNGVPGVSLGAWTVAIIFLAVLAGIAWLLVRFVRQGQGFGSQGPLRVVARLPVAMNQSLLLVRVGDHLLLLGAGQRIDLLERIDDPAVVSELDAGGTMEAPQTDFRGLLEDSFRRIRDQRTLKRGGRDA